MVRLAIDFADHGALAGDSLTGTPAFAFVLAGHGVVISTPAITGTRASALFDTVVGVAQEWEVVVVVGTTGGQTLKRSATLDIEA